MTIRGLFREFAIAKELREHERTRAQVTAWQTAAWSRSDIKLPTLNEVMRSTTVQIDKKLKALEQMAVWQTIGDVFGKRRTHNPRRVRIIRG